MKTEIKIPEGYIEGVSRVNMDIPKKSHLFKGTFDDPGLPMCQFGYDRPDGSYSIFRGNRGPKGLCKNCLKRAEQGLEGVVFEQRKFALNSN